MLAILLIGADLRLLATRAAVLGRVDAEVDVSRAEEFSARMAARHYDLLVLCHTLREEDAEAITRLARRQWPEVQILQIVRESWMAGPQRPGGAAFSTPEPRRLVERTRELFHLPTNPKAGAGTKKGEGLRPGVG